MNVKRPYKHILKNLLHEQASEIIPLLLPGFQVKQVLDIEMAELKSTLIERPPTDLDRGIVGLALPGATVTGVYRTEWIEHSGKFERAYLVQNTETDKPCYLVFELQLEREDKNLPRQLLLTYARMLRHAAEDVEQEDENEDVEDEDEDVEDESEDIEDDEGEEEYDEDEEEEVERVTSARKQKYFVYPYIICPFPQAVPAHIRDEFDGEVTMAFNFLRIKLWEKDAREFLNTHVSAIYFLLPAMKNADASLLSLAIEELAQRFENDDKELGRHLTGLHMMLQLSDMMPEEEKLATKEHLKRFQHLIKDDPDDE
jgi:hypothetical protein